ncbi:MAG: hypothetical protein CL477_07215 [Acidobacteria bacterium]|jgi:hypothetical protein|nr:hypothetical protein [Acidobacteriota bacterium]MDP7339360.1 hypothetical protein [Vicinamibacterales bacterium]MDP7691717.1 hypothetical protein [Vicinamibacterales bacterium]HJN46396.1 hypothetical protein [Vicinamibacterales bacterium]|tara:strand:+ start:1402 stop:1890 length:489 start_codon:yes stop_codon:yes gene_type:complete
MKQLLLTVAIVAGVVGFVMQGGRAFAQDHGGAGHGDVSLTDQLMRADANEDGSVTSVEIASLLLGGSEGHGNGDHDGAGHHGAGGGGNPHGDLAGGQVSGDMAALAAMFGGHDGAELSRADLEARLDMLVSHADANSDAALNASEVESMLAMMETMRAGGGH